MKPILIIGSDQKAEEEALLSAAKKQKQKINFWLAKLITIRLDKVGPQIFYCDRNATKLFRSSRIIFRRTRGAQNKLFGLVLLAQKWRVPFTDSAESILSNLHKEVFLPLSKVKKIQHIPTFFVDAGAEFDLGKHKIKLPFLTKPAHGRHGDGIQILRSVNAAKRFFSKPVGDTLLVQPLLSIDEEYRVFIVGDQPLGAVHKVPPAGSRIANYAAGAEFTSCRLPAGVLREAAALCRQQGIEIGGVDLARVGSDFYLLEINRCPEFKAFAAATGQNVAAQIIEFVKSKR